MAGVINTGSHPKLLARLPRQVKSDAREHPLRETAAVETVRIGSTVAVRRALQDESLAQELTDQVH